MRKRIVFLNWMDIKNPLSGGAEKYCFEIARRLVQSDFEVIWISRRFPGSERIEVIHDVKIIRVGNRFTVYPLATIIALKLRPYLIFDSINVIPFFTPLLRRKRLLAMIHHIIPHDVIEQKIGRLSTLADFVQLKLVPFLYKNVLILANSESTKRDLSLMGFRNIWLTHLGVELPVVEEISHKENIVIAAGALRPWKRPEDIVRAFSVLPTDWKLIIFGRPENREIVPSLSRLTDELGITPRVEIAPSISNEYRSELYKISKIAMIASEKEGWGFAAIEPQAFGCPVVGYDVPGVRDSVLNNVTGILVEDGHIANLSEALLRLAANVELCKEFSANAIDWCKRLSWEHSFDDFIQASQSLIDVRHS